jgi:hypothetical protein
MGKKHYITFTYMRKDIMCLKCIQEKAHRVLRFGQVIPAAVFLLPGRCGAPGTVDFGIDAWYIRLSYLKREGR